MPLQERLSEELKTAMKARDTLRVSVLRLLQSSIKYRQIERGRDYVLTDNDLIEVIVSAVKQRKESIEQFSDGGREELAQKERDELGVLQSFLPAPMGEDELEAKIQEAVESVGASTLKDMGKVMKTLLPQILGKADSGQVSKKVKELLGRPS